jgi:hypothetical protein
MLHVFNPTAETREAILEGERTRLDETPTDEGNTVGPHKIAAWKLDK